MFETGCQCLMTWKWCFLFFHLYLSYLYFPKKIMAVNVQPCASGLSAVLSNTQPLQFPESRWAGVWLSKHLCLSIHKQGALQACSEWILPDPGHSLLSVFKSKERRNNWITGRSSFVSNGKQWCIVQARLEGYKLCNDSTLVLSHHYSVALFFFFKSRLTFTSK